LNAIFKSFSKSSGFPGNKTVVPFNGAIQGGIIGNGVNVAVNQYEQKPVAIIMNPSFEFVSLFTSNAVFNIFFNDVLSPPVRVEPKNVQLLPMFAKS